MRAKVKSKTSSNPGNSTECYNAVLEVSKVTGCQRCGGTEGKVTIGDSRLTATLPCPHPKEVEEKKP